MIDAMQGCRPTAGPVADYWDAHREKVRDPAFWMAHPLCRQAINRRISGSEHEWPLDWFKRVYGTAPFERGVSWGCGLGDFERAAVRMGLVARIDAFDISSASLEDARRAAASEGITQISFRVGDFNAPELPEREYDIAFFHQSLHHVGRLESLFDGVRRGLKPGGAVYVDEYVGPSRSHWTAAELARAQTVLDGLPAGAKLCAKVEPPIQKHDPSEAIRSDEVPGFLRENFDIIEWRPYGGQIADLIFPCVAREWTESPEGFRFVEGMMAMEDAELRDLPGSTHHLVAYGRLVSPRGETSRRPGASAGLLRRLMGLLRPGR